MRFPSPVSIQWIAELIGAEKIIGNKEGQVTGINELHTVEKGDIIFVDHPKYYDKCINSKASHIIINTEEVEVPAGKTLLILKTPLKAIAKLQSTSGPLNLPPVMLASVQRLVRVPTFIQQLLLATMLSLEKIALSIRMSQFSIIALLETMSLSRLALS